MFLSVRSHRKEFVMGITFSPPSFVAFLSRMDNPEVICGKMHNSQWLPLSSLKETGTGVGTGSHGHVFEKSCRRRVASVHLMKQTRPARQAWPRISEVNRPTNSYMGRPLTSKWLQGAELSSNRRRVIEYY